MIHRIPAPPGARRAMPRALVTVAALAAMGAIMGGCSMIDERPLALVAQDARPSAAAGTGPTGAVAASTRVKTVRPAARDPEDDAVPAVAGVPVAALPTPRQIFDFHPPGAPADSWRQPFVIDVNDGPLAADVRKTAAELKAFLATSRGDAKVASRPLAARRCGEIDVATAKPGCPAPAGVRSVAQDSAAKRAASPPTP